MNNVNALLSIPPSLVNIETHSDYLGTFGKRRYFLISFQPIVYTTNNYPSSYTVFPKCVLPMVVCIVLTKVILS